MAGPLGKIMQTQTKLLVILTALCSFNSAQAQIDSTNLKELKDRKMKSRDPFWSYCFIDGKIESQTLVDSINKYSIKVPSNYDLTVFANEKFDTYQLKSHKKKVKNTSPIFEIRIGKSISGDLEKYFDKVLIKVIGEKRLVTFGKENTNENTSFWIETLSPKNDADVKRELNYYSINPENRKIFYIAIKSYQKKRSNPDLCVFGMLIRNLKWIK